jgi:mannan endo-1,4-beta-mannosidase
VITALLAASGFVSVGTAPAIAATTGFVTRNGTQLLLDGQPYVFTGLNIYNANSDGWCGAQMTSGSRLDDALTAMGPGAKAIRSWFFQPLAINKGTGLRDWSGFDHTLAVAAAHGIKVIATLTDQWGECGSNVAGNGYKTADWYVNGYKQVQPGMLASYRDWVADVVARYRGNPTIGFWQLINEAEVTPCPAGDLQPYQTLHDWAADVSGLVKSIDSNHLVSLGTIGSGQCGADGPRYKDLHAISTIDLCEYHDYGSPTVGIPGDQYNGLQLRIDQCNALNKPIFVGEVGIIPNDVGGTLQARADAFRAKIDAQLGAGVQGFLAWAWSPQATPVSTLDNYDIGPGDPALGTLAHLRITFKMQGVVNDVDAAIGGSIAVGDPFSIVYTFDPTVPDSWDPVGYGIYNAVTASAVTIGSYSASGSHGTIYITNDLQNGDQIQDGYHAQFFDLAGPSVNGLQPDYAQIELQDYSGTGSSVPSEALPTQPLDLSAFPVTFMFMQFNDPSCVPEPGVQCPPRFVIATVESWSTFETFPPAGGTLTTDPGTGPTPADPITTSVTVPPTTNGGSVTIAETAVTETPPPGGYQFVGQQIDITSSAATSSSNPLTIVITIDSSVLLAATGMTAPPPDSIDITRAEAGNPVVTPGCTVITPALERDPCVSNRQYVNGDLQVTILTGSASQWNIAVKPVAVTVANTGYSPKSVTLAQGGIVLWTFTGSKPHSATENLKLGPAKAPLFDSGALTSGRYGYAFFAAGTYSYGSTVKGDPGSFAGSVAVPVRISPTSGGTTTPFTVTWSSSTLNGYVFDVQYRFMKAGAKSWSPLKTWQNGAAAASGVFSPPSGAGTYAFSARLRNKGSGMASLWSPETSITVH